MYASAAQRLLAAGDLAAKQAVVDELRRRVAAPSRVPTLEEFSAAFAEVRSSRTYTQQKGLALYVLRGLHAHSAASPADLKRLTVEHLAPQGGSTAVSAFDVARLGNLLLLPPTLNEQLGDKPFAAKRELLREAAGRGVHVDPRILQAEEWGAQQIIERTKSLAEEAYNHVWTLK